MSTSKRWNGSEWEYISGGPGSQGPQGNDGWSPELAVVADGERRVLQVVDWTGGEGTKPATGEYVGPTGLVSTAAAAVDIRGTQGPAPTLVNTYVASAALTTYPDGVGHSGYVTTANGWPVDGFVSGFRNGTSGAQRVQSATSGQTYARTWSGSAWTSFILYADNQDFDAKGDLLAGTGPDAWALRTIGANGTVLTADSAETTGMKWAAPSGGTSGQTYSLTPPYSTTQPAAPADGATLFSRKKGGRTLLASIGPAGLDIAYQPNLFANRVAIWNAVANSATATQVGIAVTEITAGTAVALANTNFYSMMVRERFSSTATAGTATGIRTAVAQWGRSTIRNAGGFFFVCRFGLGAVTVTNRVFIGLHTATTAIGNVDPTTLTNMVGIGCNTAQTNFYIFTNDSTGTATATSLGANFPTTSLSASAFYEFRLFCPPGDGTTAGNISYSLERLDTTGAYVEGTLTTDLPVAGTLMAAHAWHNNGTTASIAGIDIQSLYIETDN